MPSVPGRSEQITPGLGRNSLRMKTKLLTFSYQALQGPALPNFLAASHTCSRWAFLCPCPPGPVPQPGKALPLLPSPVNSTIPSDFTTTKPLPDLPPSPAPLP